MKLTAEVTHDQLLALVARALKIDSRDLALSADEDGRVNGHVATDSADVRRIERAIAKATAQIAPTDPATSLPVPQDAWSDTNPGLDIRVGA